MISAPLYRLLGSTGAYRHGFSNTLSVLTLAEPYDGYAAVRRWFARSGNRRSYFL